MVSFFRWLIGFVKFRFEDGFADGFLNDCCGGEPALRDVHFEDGVLVGKCAAYQYLSLCRIAKLHGGRLKIVEKRGLAVI